MKVLYDHQIYSLQKHGGISRYFTQIIKNLPSDIQPEISVKFSDNEYLKNSNLISSLENNFTPYRPLDKMLHGVKFKGKKKILNIFHDESINQYINSWELNEQYSIERLKKQDFDVFHTTYYDTYFLDYIGEKPFVLTIHDMIHELYPEIVNDFKTITAKAELARRANHIIAVSETTKQDIIDVLKIPEKKISVIYHANSLSDQDIKVDNIPDKYILFVGERSGYKNFLFMVEALIPIMEKFDDLRIVCTGKNFNEEEKLFLEKFNLLSRFICLNASDSTLVQLYKKAVCLISPSYYEGFGIPIIEAFSAGCPVLASDISCYNEIAKDAALFFDPKNMTDIVNRVEIIINDSELKNKMILKGQDRSKNFSWKSAAEKTSQIYQNILHKC